jgi:GDP-D-mannose dehydratase
VGSITSTTLWVEGEFRRRDRQNFVTLWGTLLTLPSMLREGDVPDLTADPKLAHEELGWKAEKDLQTMCKDLWNWQSQNPKGQS